MLTLQSLIDTKSVVPLHISRGLILRVNPGVFVYDRASDLITAFVITRPSNDEMYSLGLYYEESDINESDLITVESYVHNPINEDLSTLGVFQTNSEIVEGEYIPFSVDDAPIEEITINVTPLYFR